MPKVSDDEIPPASWQPKDADRERMRREPTVDLDLSLGGKAEEQSGLRWLAEQRRSAERTVPPAWIAQALVAELRSALESARYGRAYLLARQLSAAPLPDPAGATVAKLLVWARSGVEAETRGVATSAIPAATHAERPAGVISFAEH